MSWYLPLWVFPWPLPSSGGSCPQRMANTEPRELSPQESRQPPPPPSLQRGSKECAHWGGVFPARPLRELLGVAASHGWGP